jgi:hypothetical protein
VPTGQPRPCGGPSHNREARPHAIRTTPRIEEVLMGIDDKLVEEAVAVEAAPFNIVLEARP